MTVETQAPGAPIWGDNPRIIDCKKDPRTADKPFADDPCECEEICAKVAEFNKGDKKRMDTTSKAYEDNRAAGNKAAAAFREDNQALLAGGAAPSTMQSKFVADCRYQEWANNKPVDTGFRKPTMLEADHVQEIQFGGAPGPENLKFLSEKVNGFMGPKLQHYKEKHTGLKAENCGCT